MQISLPAEFQMLICNYASAIATRFGCVVKVPALSSGACRFNPRSWQLVESHSGNMRRYANVRLCMIDGRKKTKICKISERLSVKVSVGAELRNGYVTERAQSSAAWCQRLCSGGMEDMVS